MGWHWRVSVMLNRLLCGRAYQPLCARVYEANPSIFRTAFMRFTDWLFSEENHCHHIHRRWMRK